MEARQLLGIGGLCSICNKGIDRLTDVVITHRSRKHRRILILCEECIDKMRDEFIKKQKVDKVD